MRHIIRKEIRRKRNRSGEECCVICNTKTILIEHHIEGRDIANANAWWNLVNICDNCHRLVHSDRIVIEKWCSTTEGKKLLWHYQNEESITGESARPYIIPSQTR